MGRGVRLRGDPFHNRRHDGRNAYREGSIRSQYISPCLRVGREQPGDIILAPLDIVHGSIAKEEPEGELGFGVAC